MEPSRPNFTLAPSAKDAFAYIITQMSGQPVIAFVWTVGARVKEPNGEWHALEPHWGVGSYDESSFPEMLRIAEVDGIRFAYGFPSDHLLDGGTVHFIDGHFRVEKSA